MAKERLSLLQKQILEIYKEESRKLNIKRFFGIGRARIARRLGDKTEKIYRIPRPYRYASEKEESGEIMQKILLMAQTEVAFNSGTIDEKTKEETIRLINNSLSPDAKELLNSRRERMKLHEDYDKRQVSLTRSLKSLVEKKFLSISKMSHKKPVYYITQKGLETALE